MLRLPATQGRHLLRNFKRGSTASSPEIRSRKFYRSWTTTPANGRATTAETIRTKSPTSLKLAFRQLREGRKLDFDDCMRMEFRMVNRVIAGHDFYEGVRATIIDKDQSPKWQPATLEAVSDAEIDAYFAPLGEKELKL